MDGVTAAAILSEGIRALGGDVIVHIPNRFEDGYGLTRAGVRAVRDRGATLLVSVDCGINANPEIDYAAELGVGVVVLDHHEPPAVLPHADAIVDPKLGGGPPEFDGLASVAWRSPRCARSTPPPAWRSMKAPYLELAALGTVADMVPLAGENRRLVREGLKALAASRRPGVQALLAAAAVPAAKVTAEAIGYRLAPRINAAGRLRARGAGP
ncbi:MAG: DHH family phosphoesterase [Dehalococcoidia bacterium]